VTDRGPTEGPGPSHVPTVAPDAGPTGVKRIRRPWLPWAAIVIVIAAALAIALPLTLGSSSSTATPTPKSASTSIPDDGGLSGTYFSLTVEHSRLLLLQLVQLQTTLSGVLTVTRSDPTHTHLVDHLYAVSGSVEGPTIRLSIGSAALGSRNLVGTYGPDDITIYSSSTHISLERGTVAMYRALVLHDRTALLG
jgi:hypothetical protein